MENIFRGFGIEIEPVDKEQFLRIRETLTRIGIISSHENRLFQSCHILHKQGQYAIMHFKELFLFDGKKSKFTSDDRARLHTIVSILNNWNLIKVIDPSVIRKTNLQVMNPDTIREDDIDPKTVVAVLSYHDKGNWSLEPKYLIGSRQKV